MTDLLGLLEAEVGTTSSRTCCSVPLQCKEPQGMAKGMGHFSHHNAEMGGVLHLSSCDLVCL